MDAQEAMHAIIIGKRVRIHYDDYDRVVEVHAVGMSTAANEVMRVWQSSGGTHSESPAWKLLRLDQTRLIEFTSESSAAPRDGYKKGDRSMSRIYSEV